MASKSKRMVKAKEMIDRLRAYELQEALALLNSIPAVKFDESIDLAIRLGVDPRKAEENVRGTVSLPHGTGKTVRLVAFCKGEKIREAQDAGADFAGAEDIVEKIQGGWLDFDAAVATPDMMVLVGKIGRLLGPRGLMPNPKVGTVTTDIVSAVKAIKGGRVEFRVEKAGIVHVGVGKRSFGPAKLEDNIKALIEALNKAKPKAAKGIYLQSAHISTTMGPGITLEPAALRAI